MTNEQAKTLIAKLERDAAKLDEVGDDLATRGYANASAALTYGKAEGIRIALSYLTEELRGSHESVV